MISLARLFTALLAFVGVTSCGGASAADWQTLDLPGVGILRLRHAHHISPADTAPATATAQTLIQWTRSHAWDPLKVLVDDAHPLVIKFKARDLLILTPEDASLPIIWLSLETDHRALLEDRGTGRLSIHAPPTGKSLNLHWLGL